MDNIKSHMIEIITSILVIITGLYAFFTYKILHANEKVIKEMQAQREESFRPYILISGKPIGHIFYLIIKNTGISAANNLVLNIDKDIYMYGKKTTENNLKSQEPFKSKIKAFVPEAEIYYDLGTDITLFADPDGENRLPKKFTISASYGFQDKQYQEDTHIDLTIYENTMILSDGTVSALNNINRTLESFKPSSLESLVNNYMAGKNKASDSKDKK